MTTPRKKQVARRGKCKAKPADAPNSTAEPLRFAGFERPWMAGFVAEALRTADVPTSLEHAQVGWGDYAHFRRSSPAFAVACTEVDFVVRSALLIRLEALASTGDPKAVKLLLGGMDQIRETLGSAGIDADAKPPAERPELVKVGRYALPPGPCSGCARGLVVLHQQNDRFTHVLVRNDAVRDLDLPEPTGHKGCQVVYGFDPDGRNEDGVFRISGKGGSHDVLAEHCLPELTQGPTMTRMRADLEKRQQVAKTGMSEVDFPLNEYPPGRSPPEEIADRYELCSDKTGQFQVWRLRPGLVAERIKPQGGNDAR